MRTTTISRPRSFARRLAATSIAAALLAAPAARADGVDPAAATQPQKQQAQALLFRGRAFVAKKKFSEAAIEFRASLNVVASPNTRLALARCLVEMNALVEAYTELVRTIADARALAPKEPRYAETADAAEADRKELTQKVVVLTLKIDHMAADTVVKINDREVSKEILAAPIALLPGMIDVVVTTGGKEASRSTSALGAGETTVTLDAEPPKPAPPPTVEPPKPPTTIDPSDIPRDDTPKPKPPPPPPAPNTGLRTGAYIAGGVGVLGFAGFALFGALEKSTYSDLQSACHNGPCPANKQNDVSTGKTQQTLANVGLVVGVVGVATGATLFVLSLPKSSPSATASSAQIVVGPSFVGVRGSL